MFTGICRGFRSQAERRRVLLLLAGCRHLEQLDDLWAEAGDLGFLLARRGVTVRSFELLIATPALGHGVAVLVADANFRGMRLAGVPLLRP